MREPAGVSLKTIKLLFEQLGRERVDAFARIAKEGRVDFIFALRPGVFENAHRSPFLFLVGGDGIFGRRSVFVKRCLAIRASEADRAGMRQLNCGFVLKPGFLKCMK